MNLKSLLCNTAVFIFLCIFMLCKTDTIVNAESESPKVILDISEKNLTIQMDEKMSLSKLEKNFPTELEVTLENGEKEQVPVTWECEVNYEKEEYDSYVFEGIFSTEYILAETCETAYIMVVLSEDVIPEKYIAWDANPDSSKRLDAYLGVTGNVVQWLESHEKDDYYLGTKYYGDLDYPRKCTRANGEYKSMGYDSDGMNCTGFVASVMRKLGGNLDKIVEYSSWGKYANAYNWHYTAHNKSIQSYRYTSITKMLESGKLEKGDVIYFEPDWSLSGVDCHMGFFWGDSSDDNKFWHSIKGEGNVITKIKSKSSYQYVYIFKTTPPGKLKVTKASGRTSITSNNENYSLKDAVFGVYTTYDSTTGKVSDRVTSLTTKASGTTETISLKKGTYYIKEITAPKGYVLSDEVKKVTISSGSTVSVTYENEPQAMSVDILLQKIDAETKEKTPAEGREFVNARFRVKFYNGYYDNVEDLKNVTPMYSWLLKTDKNGVCKLKKTYKVSGSSFVINSDGEPVLPLGTVTIQETKAPYGYEKNTRIFLRKVTGNVKGETLKVFQAIKIPEEKSVSETPVIPSTGDEANLIGRIITMVFSIFILKRNYRAQKEKIN